MKRNSSEQILTLLRKRGSLTALLISEKLGITKEGARKHLLNLSDKDLVKATLKSEGVGRPSTYYSLTEKGLSHFPNTHADISVQLIKSVKKLLGNNALDLLVKDREADIYNRYSNDIKDAQSLDEKLDIITNTRTREGYMAEWTKNDDTYYLIENHCPIANAARECNGFCHSELRNFRLLLGKEYSVEREEYIINADNRCIYRIEKIN